jgi:hypothetical protein
MTERNLEQPANAWWIYRSPMSRGGPDLAGGEKRFETLRGAILGNSLQTGSGHSCSGCPEFPPEAPHGANRVLTRDVPKQCETLSSSPPRVRL